MVLNYNIYGYGSDFFKNYIRVITNIGYVTICYHIAYGYYNYHSQWEFQDPKMEVLYHIRPYIWWVPPF